jgi:hypothetical protein
MIRFSFKITRFQQTRSPAMSSICSCIRYYVTSCADRDASACCLYKHTDASFVSKPVIFPIRVYAVSKSIHQCSCIHSHQPICHPEGMDSIDCVLSIRLCDFSLFMHALSDSYGSRSISIRFAFTGADVPWWYDSE